MRSASMHMLSEEAQRQWLELGILPEEFRHYLLAEDTQDLAMINDLKKGMKLIANEASAIVDIFQDDRDRAKYGMILVFLGLKGQATRNELGMKLDIEKSGVSRHLNLLREKGYAQTKPPFKGKSPLYFLQHDGVLVCSFLGIDDETLWKRVQDAESYAAQENLSNEMKDHIAIKPIYSAKIPLPPHLKAPPFYSLRCQSDYVKRRLPRIYLKTTWGKRYVSIKETKPEALESFDFVKEQDPRISDEEYFRQKSDSDIFSNITKFDNGS
ncbi:MAG: MarR family transcriptional regulator [Rhabdochlamydiaceae bacterium]